MPVLVAAGVTEFALVRRQKMAVHAIELLRGAVVNEEATIEDRVRPHRSPQEGFSSDSIP